MNRHSLRLAVMVFAIAVGLAFCAPTPSAQDNMSGQSNMSAQGDTSSVEARLEKLSAELQLTRAQKEQIRPILVEEVTKIRAANSNPSKAPLQRSLEMKQIGRIADAKVKPILNSEQYQRWQQIRAQERKRMMEKMESRQARQLPSSLHNSHNLNL